MFYVQNPSTGVYTLNLNSTNTGDHDIGLYLYDVNGNVSTETIPTALLTSKSSIINLSFNKQNSIKSTANKVIAFESVISDINTLKSLNLIKNSIAEELIGALKRIEKSYNKKFALLTKLELRLLNDTLNFYNYKNLNKDAYKIISQDIKDLTNNL